MIENIKNDIYEEAINHFIYIKNVEFLNRIFNDKEINKLIIENFMKGESNIKNLKDCQNEIKPSTFYLGMIKRCNDYIKIYKNKGGYTPDI